MSRKLVAVLGLVLLSAGASHAYIAVPAERLTLCEVMLEFPTVLALRLEKSNAKTGAAVFSIDQVFQGPGPVGPVRVVLRDGQQIPERLRGLKKGDVVVAFLGSPDKRSLFHSPAGWFLTVPDQDWERFTQFRDDFQSLFAGTPSELCAAIAELRRGGSVVVACQPKGLSRDEQLHVRYDADFPHRRWPALPPRHQRLDPNALARAVKSKSVVERQRAMLELPAGKEAEEFLRKGLADLHPEVRLAAAMMLGMQSEISKESLQALAKRLEDDDRFVCAFAARSLGQAGTKAEFALPELLNALSDRDANHDFRPHRAAEAAEAILAIAPESPSARTAVRFFLSDRMLRDHRIDSEGTRTAAARALGRGGPAARSALPELMKCLDDSVAETRIAAAEAILLVSKDKKDRTQAVKTLQKEIPEGTGFSRIQAIRAAARTNSSDLVPILESQLKNPDAVLRAEAANALGILQGQK